MIKTRRLVVEKKIRSGGADDDHVECVLQYTDDDGLYLQSKNSVQIALLYLLYIADTEYRSFMTSTDFAGEVFLFFT